MPDVQATIRKVWTANGSGDYGDWTRYDVAVKEGDAKVRYKTFNDELGQKAQASEGRRVLITFTEKDGGNMIDSISDPLDDAPTAGASSSGPGTRMAEAPETQASIRAAVALQQAVQFGEWASSDGPGPDVLADTLTVAEHFYGWLESKVDAVAPPAASQGVSEPSQEQRQRLDAIVKNLNEKHPKQEGQKPWLDDLAVFCRETFGKEGGLNSQEYETLIGYAEGLGADEELPF